MLKRASRRTRRIVATLAGVVFAIIGFVTLGSPTDTLSVVLVALIASVFGVAFYWGATRDLD
jgi:uncharacterized membrane protein YccC